MRDYAVGRVLRIVPAYWAVLVITGVQFPAALVRSGDQGLSLGRLTAHPGQLLADALLAQNDYPATGITGIGTAWTLAIEVVYVVMPLLALPLVALAARRSDPRARIRLAFVSPLVLLVGGALSHTATRLSPALAGEGWGADLSAVYHRSFAYNAALFTPGMAAAVVAVLLANGTVRPRRAALTGALALVAFATPAHALDEISTALYEGVAAVAFALITLGLATGEQGRLARPLEHTTLVFIGLISYSVFLWHEPVTRWLASTGPTVNGAIGVPINLALVLAIVIPLSFVSYRLLELPAMSLRRTRTQLPPTTDKPAGRPF